MAPTDKASASPTQLLSRVGSGSYTNYCYYSGADLGEGPGGPLSPPFGGILVRDL